MTRASRQTRWDCPYCGSNEVRPIDNSEPPLFLRCDECWSGWIWKPNAEREEIEVFHFNYKTAPRHDPDWQGWLNSWEDEGGSDNEEEFF